MDAPINVGQVKVNEPAFARPELMFCPEIPATLSGVNPRTIKGQAWWDRERKAAYAANQGCCWACGDSGRLEGHEVYSYRPSENRVDYLYCVALCELCHAFIHVSSVVPKMSMDGAYALTAHGLGLRSIAKRMRPKETTDFIALILPEGEAGEYEAPVDWRLP